LIVPVAFFRPPSIRCLSIFPLQTFLHLQSEQAPAVAGSGTMLAAFRENRQSREMEHHRDPLC